MKKETVPALNNYVNLCVATVAQQLTSLADIHQGRGSIRDCAQWVKTLAEPKLWCGSQLRLASDPWPGKSICHGAAKKEKRTKERKIIMGVPIMAKRKRI